VPWIILDEDTMVHGQTQRGRMSWREEEENHATCMCCFLCMAARDACNAAQPGSQLKKEERSFPGMVPIV
jgi:hypothetical protein